MYNQLILVFIIFIVVVYCLNKYEHFSSEDKKIVGNKDIFLPSYDLQNLQNIKINKICIKDSSSGEIECLTKEQLFNAMELPIFRKHAICIDDACVSKNNLLKINKKDNFDGSLLTNFKHVGDKCFNINTVRGAAGAREQKKWEKDTYGKVKYNLLNRPKGGWKRKSKAKQGKTWCKKNKYNSLDKYGCKAPIKTTGKICWSSSGGRCLRELRKKKRRMKRRKNDSRIISSTIPKIPVLKEDECSENTGFNIQHGDLIGTFNFINVPPKFNTQVKPEIGHETHGLIEQS